MSASLSSRLERARRGYSATRASAFSPANGSRSLSCHSRAGGARSSIRGTASIACAVTPAPSRTGSGSSIAAQRRTTSRLTLSVCVRGKSSSGQIRNAGDPLVNRERRVRGLDRRPGSTRGRPASSPSASRAARRTMASIRPGRVSTTTESRTPAVRRAFSMSSGIHVQAVRQDDDVLRPAHEDEPAGVVEPADVAGPVPAVVGERRRGRLGVVPVALEDRRAAELDLAVVGEPQLDRRHGPPDRPEPVVLARRARPEARSRSSRSPG